MTRMPRLLLAAVLAVGLSAPRARAAEPDKLLPADADTVAVINLKQILDSALIKKYALEQIKQALEGQDAKQLLDELGIDPLKDVEKLTIASIDTSRDNTKFFMLVNGNFDPEKLFKTAEAYSKKDADRFSMVRDGGTVMFKFQPDDGQPPVYATVVNDKTIVAASEKKLISNAIAADSGNKAAPLKKELADLIKKADAKASVYVATILKGKLDDLMIPGGGNLPIKLDDLQRVLPKLETALISVKIGADVTLEVNFGMQDDESAGDMRNALDDLFKQLKPLAQLAAAAEPRAKPLGDILASLKITSKNKDVTLSGKITSDNIAQIVNPND
jgi:hypothetical protein